MADLAMHMAAVTEEFARTTEVDTLDRAQTRVRMIFDMFYDDEEVEPDQAIRDALTDLMHVAADRDVDFDFAVERAAEMYEQEHQDWEARDE